VDADEALLTLDLPRKEEAAGAARKALAALNGSLHLVSEARLSDAQLVVTELVANAVQHAGSGSEPVSVRVRSNSEVMRVEVTDDGSGFDPGRLPEPSPDRSGGWGLQIVALLAHRWGVDCGSRTTVWYEIDRPQQEVPVRAQPVEPTTDA
jgi:anti-sigma regulatory factor (Ser/Thr protein kinase)